MRIRVEIHPQFRPSGTKGWLVGFLPAGGCDRCDDDQPRAVVQVDGGFGLFLETFHMSAVTPIQETDNG